MQRKERMAKNDKDWNGLRCGLLKCCWAEQFLKLTSFVFNTGSKGVWLELINKIPLTSLKCTLAYILSLISPLCDPTCTHLRPVPMLWISTKPKRSFWPLFNSLKCIDRWLIWHGAPQSNQSAVDTFQTNGGQNDRSGFVEIRSIGTHSGLITDKMYAKVHFKEVRRVLLISSNRTPLLPVYLTLNYNAWKTYFGCNKAVVLSFRQKENSFANIKFHREIFGKTDLDFLSE